MLDKRSRGHHRARQPGRAARPQRRPARARLLQPAADRGVSDGGHRRPITGSSASSSWSGIVAIDRASLFWLGAQRFQRDVVPGGHLLRRVGAGARRRLAGQVPRRHHRHRAPTSPSRPTTATYRSRRTSTSTRCAASASRRRARPQIGTAVHAREPARPARRRGHHRRALPRGRLLRPASAIRRRRCRSRRPWNYVPSAPSTLRSLEEAALEFANRLPELGDQTTATLSEGREALIEDARLVPSASWPDELQGATAPWSACWRVSIIRRRRWRPQSTSRSSAATTPVAARRVGVGAPGRRTA